MKSLAFAGSVLLQSVYVVTLGSNIIVLLRADLASFYDTGDPAIMAGFISSLTMRLAVGAAVGLTGVLVAWMTVRRFGDPPSWFLSASGVFGLAWVLFFPIGTIVAAFMLRWRYRVMHAR